MKLAVKIVPGSSREGIAGWLGHELKIRVRQAPEAGRANEAVRKLIAKTLELPLDQVQILAGSSSPHKTMEISGVSEATVLQKLPAKAR